MSPARGLALLQCNQLGAWPARSTKSPYPECVHIHRHAPDGHSILSLAFAASTVCHCMFDGASRPPRFNGMMWSIT